MAGKIIVHGFNQMGWGPTDTTLFIDSNMVAVVRKKETVEIPINKNCLLSAKIGINKSRPIEIKDGRIVEVQVFNGARLELRIINETVINPNDEEVVYEFDGGSGDILLVYADRIVIKHKGVLNLMAMGIKGDKTLYYSDVTAVQYKRPGILAGHIQFSILGGHEDTGGVLSASSDENTITFNKGSECLAEKVVEYINQKLKEIKVAKNQGTIIQQATSPAEELKKMKELLDMGIITQEEFDAKKKQLLGL